jgi:tetratricopeptide (TPR) repeat protein
LRDFFGQFHGQESTIQCKDAETTQPGNTDDSKANLRVSEMRIAAAFWLLLLCAAAPAIAGAQLSSAPAAAAEATPAYDPLKANKDMEVGTYYFKKGNYDAAIDRFEEAARLQPGLARPYLKLGETYEKKKNLPMAVASYRRYLDLFRAAPDARTVSKRIEELEKRIARDAGTRQER